MKADSPNGFKDFLSCSVLFGATMTEQARALGIAAVVLGGSAVVIPYPVALFVALPALVGGFVAYREGKRGLGGAGMMLGFIRLISLFFVT